MLLLRWIINQSLRLSEFYLLRVKRQTTPGDAIRMLKRLNSIDSKLGSMINHYSNTPDSNSKLRKIFNSWRTLLTLDKCPLYYFSTNSITNYIDIALTFALKNAFKIRKFSAFAGGSLALLRSV